MAFYEELPLLDALTTSTPSTYYESAPWGKMTWAAKALKPTTSGAKFAGFGTNTGSYWMTKEYGQLCGCSIERTIGSDVAERFWSQWLCFSNGETATGYRIKWILTTTELVECKIYNVAAGVETLLGSSTTFKAEANDVYVVYKNGKRIEAYRKKSAGAYEKILSAEDKGTEHTKGFIGFDGQGSDPYFLAFKGGETSSSSPPKFTAKLTASSAGTGKLKTPRLFTAKLTASSAGTGKLKTPRLFKSVFQAFSSFTASLTDFINSNSKEAEYVNGGRWRKKLGSVGYILAFWESPSGSGKTPEYDVSRLPPGVTYKVTGAESFAWRLREPIGTQNAAAVENFTETETALANWYGGLFTVEIKSAKQFYGTITFYCIDEQNGGSTREQTISDGVVLRNVANFTEGQYATFVEAIPAGGSVTFTFISTKGSNATCSAVFFDATPSIRLQAVENGGTGQLYTGTSSAAAPAVGANPYETWLLNNVFGGV